MVWEEQFHACSSLRVVTCLNATTMVDGDLLHDGESKPAATAIGSCPGGVTSIEALEHLLEVWLAQSGSVITNREQPPASTLLNGDFHPITIRGVAQSIVEQVEDGAMQTRLVAPKAS